jgi:hypothetical protein
VAPRNVPRLPERLNQTVAPCGVHGARR